VLTFRTKVINTWNTVYERVNKRGISMNKEEEYLFLEAVYKFCTRPLTVELHSFWIPTSY
jgi:hypothetical protein